VIDAQLWKEELKNESAAVDGQRQATLKQSLLDLARGISSEASKLVQQSDHSLHEVAVNLAPIFTQYAVLIQVLHSQAAGHIPMLAAGSGAAFPDHKTTQFLEIREPGSEVRDLAWYPVRYIVQHGIPCGTSWYPVQHGTGVRHGIPCGMVQEHVMVSRAACEVDSEVRNGRRKIVIPARRGIL
jgi:hypothetical protein